MRLFGLFKRSEPSPDLDERLESLERQVKRLRLEWEDVYEKVARLMGRIAKRQALIQEAETREDAPGPPERAGLPLDPISQQVLARRRLGGVRNERS